MKLLTLNTHSFAEENYEQKLNYFADAVSAERPDVIALQEVSQFPTAAAVDEKKLAWYYASDKNAVITEDNHVFRAVQLLAEKGVYYYWTWIPLKLGYNKYDEGIALMSRSRITASDIITVSGTDDYNNWKTRKLLGISTEAAPDEWFYSVHYGWWSDDEEPFLNQWRRTVRFIDMQKKVWLMGDFNSPAEVRNEGYDLICSDGWYDSFTLAVDKDDGVTVEKVIDGWRDKVGSVSGMRIDHIWCSEKSNVKSSSVVFNGRRFPVISDHYGVMTETV